MDLGIDGHIIITKQATSLRVSHQDILAPSLFEHAAAQLAGEGSAICWMKVLASNRDAGVLEALNDCRNGDGWRCDQDVDTGIVSERLPEAVGERSSALRAQVHLPVSSDEETATHEDLRSLMTRIPGSGVPSTNAREAPPPVDMWPTLSSSSN